MTGMSLPARGWRWRWMTSRVLPSWVIAVVLPVPGRAGQDQAAPAGVGVAVEVGQPASLGDDLADDRGRDDQQPGVVVEPGLVVGQPPGVAEPPPLPVPGSSSGGTGSSSTNRRQPARTVSCRCRDSSSVAPAGRGGDGGCAHQRFFASSWALKIPSGITLATGSPLSCPGVSGASSVAGGHRLGGRSAACCRGGARAGGDPPVPGRRPPPRPGRARGACPGVVRRPVVGAAQQVIDGLGAFQLGGVAAALPGQPSRDVVPGQFPERERDFPQVLPRAGDPAAGPADEHPRHVIGVAADLPQPLAGGDAGFLLPDRVQLRGVVGPVADLDAVGVDGPPDRGQQLDVVLGAERDRHVPGRLDQRGVLLVRGERPLRVQRVPQPVVGPVLPDRYEPFVEKVLHLHEGPQRLLRPRGGPAGRRCGPR